MKLLKPMQIDFLKFHKQAGIISITFIVITIASLFIRGLNLSTDLSGGLLVEISFDEPFETKELRNILSNSEYNKASVKNVNESTFFIELPTTGVDDSTIKQLIIYLSQHTKQNVNLIKSEFVGSQVGEDLRDQSGVGFIIAMLFMMAYISIRFQYKFAIGALFALFHDVLFVMGVFSLFQIEFSLNALAAVLAVVGYSINDTIIIFDRIRERFYNSTSEDSYNNINVALNTTMSRTLITSLTTLLVIVSLLMVGPDVIFDFALALLIGVIVGTYSSIFIASSMLIYLNISRDNVVPSVEDDKELRLSP